MDTFSRETISALDPWYVTGFVDGEGAFTFSRNGRQMSLYFAIKLTAIDRPLLLQLQAFFGGIGEIYSVRARGAATAGSGSTRAASYYRVCRRDHLPRVVQHFDAFPLRGAKRASYAVWREMVLLKQRFRQPEREKLEALATRLSAASPRNRTWVDTPSEPK